MGCLLEVRAGYRNLTNHGTEFWCSCSGWLLNPEGYAIPSSLDMSTIGARIVTIELTTTNAIGQGNIETVPSGFSKRRTSTRLMNTVVFDNDSKHGSTVRFSFRVRFN